MENQSEKESKKTEKADPAKDLTDKLIGEATKNEEVYKPLLKAAMSMIGFVAGMVASYFFIVKAKDKEIERLREQLGELKEENREYKDRLRLLENSKSENDLLRGDRSRRSSQLRNNNLAYLD